MDKMHKRCGSNSDNKLTPKQFRQEQQNTAKITRLDDLCTDIVYELFEYFNVNELYLSFYNLTSSMKHIIDNYSLPLHVDLSKRDSFNYFSEFIVPHLIAYPKQVTSLKLSSIITYPFTLSIHFQSLRALTLLRMYSKNMIPILKQFPQLSYVYIGNHSRHSNGLITTILKIPTLKTFIFKSLTHLQKLPLTTRNTSNIEHLSIRMNSHSLCVLLLQLPKIRYLNIDISYSYDYDGVMFDIPVMSCLTKLKMEIGRFPASFANQLFKRASNLQYLHFVGTTSDKKCLDSTQWTNLLFSIIEQLKRIKLNLHYSNLISALPDRIEIVEKFQTNVFLQQHNIHMYDESKGESAIFRIIADYQK
ncbi:unnamed protein product [Didymodactylos carnosus]|uniref:F-box domain-containing protein n=1 Tax=Didymodactylos carnosus TaxID=1234261 RepID=A0A814WES1_9BILA|nr:unnamed protein product [Didymodactylos carnosus]CAF1373853.1 unnamed protein product [Didymodactylos carnosus]CAF3961974.1 unnamed protein product [Didymodactylos carnosus]CAF4182780.1 unnamed protein product [Didymodactylos carnosus]